MSVCPPLTRNLRRIPAVKPIKYAKRIWNTYRDLPSADTAAPARPAWPFPGGNPSDDVGIPADFVFDVCPRDPDEEQKDLQDRGLAEFR